MKLSRTDDKVWESARLDVQAIKFEFQRLEEALRRKPNKKNATRLIRFALQTSSSYFYSATLEQFFIDLAKKTQDPIPLKDVKEKSILHVMTTSLLTGGHTRVVERWLQSAEPNETHSVILIKQVPGQVPEALKTAASGTSGTITHLKTDDSIERKANQLRKIASEYQYIVLHHNMDDPVPLMAFGVPEFKRPVITFNHAGHLFWIGRNATDLLIDIEESQNSLTKNKRGIQHSCIIDLPYSVNIEIRPNDKESARQELELPHDSAIVVSMAQSYKFVKIGTYDFPRMLDSILQQNNKAIAVVIGVSSGTSPAWKRLKDSWPNRVILTGALKPDRAAKYLKAADLYLDSFPCNSFTSLLDAISIGQIPALSLETPVGTLPFIKGSAGAVSSVEELVAKAIHMLEHRDSRQALFEELWARINDRTSKKYFQDKIRKAYKQSSSIIKDESRFLPISEDIVTFDVFWNELIKRNCPTRTKTRQICWSKTQRSAFMYSKSILGILVYRKTLQEGLWRKTILGLRLPQLHLQRKNNQSHQRKENTVDSTF